MVGSFERVAGALARWSGRCVRATIVRDSLSRGGPGAVPLALGSVAVSGLLGYFLLWLFSSPVMLGAWVVSLGVAGLLLGVLALARQ